jgi:chromosome segregation ATPase
VTDSDLTHAILREIRDEIRATNTNLSAKIDATNDRLDRTNTNLSAKIDATNERLDVTNERLTLVEQTVSDAVSQIVLLARYVKNKHQTAIDELRERVTRLEAKSG